MAGYPESGQHLLNNQLKDNPKNGEKLKYLSNER